jgi:hypothetical protein
MASERKHWGYWKNKDNALAEARSAMEIEGWDELPGSHVLIRQGYSSLAKAINKYHGRIRTFREYLGQETERKDPGYWTNLENALAEARGAMEEQGWAELPERFVLAEYGYSGLENAIGKYHGGIQEFLKHFGQESTVKPKGYWQNPDNAIEEARKTMSERQWDRFPGPRILTKYGYSGLVNSIKRYHNGFPAFRKLLEERGISPTSSVDLEKLVEGYGE